MMRLQWHDTEERVMHWRVEGDWTEQEYLQAFETWKSFASTKSHPVDVIVDMSQAGRMPANTISILWQSIETRPHNTEVLIIVSDNKLVRAVYQTITRMCGVDVMILFSSDWEGALDILQAVQSSRAPSK